MRIAVLILTLVIGAFLFIQTFLVTALGGLAQDEVTSGAGAVGLVCALLWLIAAAFVIGLPLISMMAFVFAGILSLAMAASSDFSDLQLWGIASFVLAALSLIGWMTKRRGARVEARKLAERDERLAASIRGSMAATRPQDQA